ncbi:MAG: FG-GAP-like repeat-containing protein [Planctomycetaceae bacterium]
MHRVSCWLCLFLAPAVCGAGEPSPDSGWKRIVLDKTFRSEGVAAADVDRDGKIDVLAGDVWYKAPDWTMHEIRPVGQYQFDKGYSQSFANWAYDVNADGWDDLIVVGFPGAPCHWYENPQNAPGHWKENVIWHSACNETPLFTDITGDGKPELVLGSQPEAQVGFLPLPASGKAAEKWTFHAVGQPGDPAKNGSHRFYHGLGAGDVNRDGRTDVLIPHGWWQAPQERTQGPWEFHPWTLSRSGKGNSLPAANMFVDDLDLDGDCDVLMSNTHSYGIWWFEQVKANGGRRFEYHLIDESYSQTHALEYVDLNGDGRRELVTGKRFYAHQGHDPGGKEPVVMYWYEVKRTKGSPPAFVPHEIAAGRDTGIGTQFEVIDVNGDERPDIVLSNKKGVNVLVQVGK